MRVHSHMVPFAFWIGFLALGFATSYAGRSHAPHVSARHPVAGKLQNAQVAPDQPAAMHETAAQETAIKSD